MTGAAPPVRMLVFGSQIYGTAEMNVDRETYDQKGEQQTEEWDGPVDFSVVHPAPAEPTPPPASASSEFLASQWLQKRSLPRAYRKSGETLTPPPPSAPGEFLLAQWRDGIVPELAPADEDLAIFQDAVAEAIESSVQLENLGAGSSLPAEAPASVDREAQDRRDESGPIRLRGVRLAAGEETTLVFLPDEGLVDEVPPSGQALILTNRRLIAFRGVEGFRDTHLAMASEIAQCSVRTGQRNWGAILQGLMVMVGGAFLYLVVGYWLAGQVSGPNVPVLNIDVAPLIALLIILAGLLILASNYFTRPAGAIIFHGHGVEIAFPFRSSLDLRQVYDFVDLAHSARRQWVAGNPGDDAGN